MNTQDVFSNIAKETAAQTAIQLVIMDAIERGASDPKEIAEYMKTEVFENSVKTYMALMGF